MRKYLSIFILIILFCTTFSISEAFEVSETNKQASKEELLVEENLIFEYITNTREDIDYTGNINEVSEIFRKVYVDETREILTYEQMYGETELPEEIKGKMKIKIIKRDGEKYAILENFYPSGNIRSRSEYKTFDKNESIEKNDIKQFYRDNSFTNPYIFLSTKHTEYYENGEPYREFFGIVKEDFIERTYKIYDNNDGKLSELSFSIDGTVISSKKFYKNGNIKSFYDQKQGSYIEYDENEEAVQEIKFIYYRDTVIKQASYYEKNTLIKEEFFYDSNNLYTGKLKILKDYKNNILKEYDENGNLIQEKKLK